MDSTSLKENFNIFKSYIEVCLPEKDIHDFITDLDMIFDSQKKKYLTENKGCDKVKIFMQYFEESNEPEKYKYFKKCAEKHNKKWIYSFLTTEKRKVSELIGKWEVLQNILSLLDKHKESFEITEVFIQELYNKEIISKAYKDFLKTRLTTEGNTPCLHELFNVLSTSDPDWYGHFLYIVCKQKSNFQNIFCDDLGLNDKMEEENKEKICMTYAKDFLDQHLQQYQKELKDKEATEESIIESTKKNCEKSDDDNLSCYGSLIDENFDFDDFEDQEFYTETDSHTELNLMEFQMELVEPAINGKNVIIYAPTGSGKTNMAVYITNDHLKKYPKGKVAFLVHRIPLVNQQYRVFKKYKTPELKVIDVRGRTDNTSGPLCAHIDTSDIIVMTSEILRNALTVDNGNMINSISQFSLIFFDECHNCMKNHPYVKIMFQYFQEKRKNPNVRLPQIIGLTASPRSNKKDDMLGMKKSLYELCGNLDCLKISVVKKHISDMEDYLKQPNQKISLTQKRCVDEFEPVLIKLMVKCEKKLEKMRNERYFPSTLIKSIPRDKFKQDYVGFVGNLQKLNTFTVDENDGRQKAYCIFRYLNAFYRGLIVNQMFDQKYAKMTIKKHLHHNGMDFSCSYDEEFYNDYKRYILENDYDQSDNPAISKIVDLILCQIKKEEQSRILIFVREIDYTYYLESILVQDKDIAAEAIVGSNAKTDSKGCTDNEINHILERFKSGTTTVLVATNVVEEGLDVVHCNMVISYGHVTNETAMVQRRGRVRAVNSTYFLILPPMLSWLEKKEVVNEHRKEMMTRLINQMESIDINELKTFVENHQISQFYLKTKISKPVVADENVWKFTCKNCQIHICTSESIRIIERAHRIIILPELLQQFRVVKEPRKAFGSNAFYEYGGKVLCIKCHNFILGNYIYYKKIPFFQLNIVSCNGINKEGKVQSFKKWADFAKLYEISDLNSSDSFTYFNKLETLMDSSS